MAHSYLGRIWYSLSCSTSFDRVIILPDPNEGRDQIDRLLYVLRLSNLRYEGEEMDRPLSRGGRSSIRDFEGINAQVDAPLSSRIPDPIRSVLRVSDSFLLEWRQG